MGAWGCDVFENDDAGDWAYGLEDRTDLGLVTETIERVLAQPGYLEAPDASAALAACEVIARAVCESQSQAVCGIDVSNGCWFSCCPLRAHQ